MSRSAFRAHSLVLRHVQVRRVEDITPRMRRITVGGEELGAFARDGMSFPAFAPPAFDDHVKLIFAPGGDIADALPRQNANGIDWLPSEHRVTRDYTPHHVDADVLEAQFDFVVHTDGQVANGPAEEWARAAVPGSDLWFVGPKASLVLPDDVAELILIGDETALPAITRFFDERPLDIPVHALITVATEAAIQAIVTRPGDSADFVVAQPGDAEALLAAAQKLTPGEGPVYVWAAAESRALLPVRRHAKREWAIPKSHMAITGYWHVREESDADAATAEEAAGPVATPITSPVPWLATRAALKLGLLTEVALEPAPRAALERRANVTAGQLDPLLAILVDCDILRVDADHYRAGAVGDALLDDEHAQEEFVGLYADQVVALGDLADGLGAGGTGWATRTGNTLRDTVTASSSEYAELVDEAEGLRFLMPALSRLPFWADRSRIALGGPSALVVADGLRIAEIAAELVVVEDPEPLRALREGWDSDDLAFADSWPADTPILLASALEHRTDAEVLAHLDDLRTVTDTVYLMESTELDGLNARAAEQALVTLGAIGVPPRNLADLGRLVAQAGWSVASTSPLGWGVECLELVPAERN
ncbi:siderophore-interacting protein [Gordonia desulfuricans]|uniref:Siderophore-interacting protein n=1 Tax=Gordonia desulfuricans TaxID=89051 RepID=A0A7K3LNP7_9ACTN|nr:siderophore-interacting protein [Gordonia desulfuricans]NDK89875.1 siderophore-interacting protein [Gordonia desulfuricans]